jgi:RNA polymerase sigma factor (sigma-70 family)
MSELLSVEDAAESAFRRHYGQIYRFVRRRTVSHEHAEDLTQAVFADTAAARDRLKGEPPLVLGWLYRVARRRLADDARRSRRTVDVVPLEAVTDAARAEAGYGADLATVLASAIARLPRGQREVVILKLLQGRSFAEIARRIGITPAACKMRLVRGLEALREDLEREGISP